MQIVSVEKNKHIVMLTDSTKPMKPEKGKKEFILPLPGNRQMAFNWSFNLIELPEGKTRYLARCLATFDPMVPPVDFLIDFFAVFASCIMQIEQLRQIKQLAEGTHPAM
jgi:hypothetical protein